MSDTSLNRLHIAFMEDFLPIGMAIINRAKKRGVGEVFDEITFSSDNLQTLRGEGIESAKSIRDKLDQIRPGFGNPVIEVKAKENFEEFICN